MSVQSTDYMDVVTYLPLGGRLTLYGIDWDEYEQLLVQLDEHSHLRVSFNQGRLEIMSPSAKHEQYKNLLHDFVMLLSDELEREVLSFGSTTLKVQPQRRGAEGDDCFYIQHASAVTGKNFLDLRIDPPPDLVIEIDLTSESVGKFAIYAALGVTELWHYDGDGWRIWGLNGNDYHLVTHSIAFPFVTSVEIADFVMQSETIGPLKARRRLRQWVDVNKSQGGV
jgi:Uma2 family endonuclease